jgi:hypothetical protein
MTIRYLVLTSVLGASLATFGCGSSDPDGPGGSVDAGDDNGTPDAAPNPDGWTDLVTGTWTIGAGSESYWCSRITVEEDMYIAGFRAIDPVGTHHTVVTLQDSGADEEFGCGAGTLADEMIFASGVGTDDLIFPDGVAIKVPAGRKILLNLHLFNVSDQPINGTSGTQVKLIPASEVTDEAEVVFAGTFGISLPPNQETTLTGRCTFDNPSKVISVWPHMHQLGTHMKVFHEAGGGDDKLHDKPYSFEEQVNYKITPVDVAAGEKIRVECTWNNTTGQTVTFGDSSEAEMCFAGLYRYPKDGSNLFCTDGFNPF